MKNQEAIWNIEYRKNEQKWRRETINLPKFIKNKKVLEIGVGNGKTLRAILRQNPKNIVVMDFSSEALNRCKKIFHEKKISFVKANVANLPFENEEFDIIVCYYVLNNLLEKEREKAVKEINRVLKTKGKLLFEDFAVGDFRETNKNQKTIEFHTIKNKKGIICHFFELGEIKKLFNGFSAKKLAQKTFNPIIHKPKLKRKIISGIFVK